MTKLLPSLTSWHVPGKCVRIKAIKVSDSTMGSNQVRMFLRTCEQCVLSPFWQSGLSLKSLYLSYFKWQTRKRRKDNFLLFLFEYSQTNLHMNLRTICFLTRFTVHYGAVGHKAGYRKCSVTLKYLSSAFLYWLAQFKLPLDWQLLEFWLYKVIFCLFFIYPDPLPFTENNLL